MSNTRHPSAEYFDSNEVSESMLIKLIQSQRDGEFFWQKLSKRIQNLKNLQSQSELSDEASLKGGTKFMTPIAKAQIGLLAASILAAMVFATLYLAIRSPEAYPVSNGHTWSAATSKDHLDSVQQNVVEPLKFEFVEPVETDFTIANLSAPLKSSISDTCKSVFKRFSRDANQVSVPVNLTVKAVESGSKAVAPIAKPVRSLVDSSVPRKHIEFSFEFNKSGYGRMAINEKNVGAKMGPTQFAKSVDKIKTILDQRMQFLGPRIGLICGNVCIESDKISDVYSFESSRDLDWAFDKIKNEFGKIDSNYRRKSRPRVDPVFMLHHESKKAIDELFQQWGKESLESGGIELRLHQNSNGKFLHIIEMEAFKKFVRDGKFELPSRTPIYLPLTTIQTKDADELRNTLSTVKEVGLFADNSEFQKFSSSIATRRTEQKMQGERISESQEPLMEMLKDRKDLEGLPLVMGEKCRLDESESYTMGRVSNSLGSLVNRNEPYLNSDGKNKLRKEVAVQACTKMMNHSLKVDKEGTQRLLTVDQILQARPKELRLAFVESLAEEEFQTAVNLLTCYVKYDLDSDVRMAATKALSNFPAKSYRAKLLQGLDYPWVPAAQHSAEAIVRLNDTKAVPMLVDKLKNQDPNTIRQTEPGVYVKRELVAINHLKNCVLCHADTRKSGLGNAPVPEWNRPLPRLYYGAKSEALNVRADVTYMRQDFSVMQDIHDDQRPRFWPKRQRMDYVVKSTVLNSETSIDRLHRSQPTEVSEYRDAIIFALQMLTDLKPADNSYKNWKSLTRPDYSTGP